MNDETHHFNGIDALTGKPAFTAMDEEVLADALLAKGADDAFLREVEKEAAGQRVCRHDPDEGVDVRDLRQTGWGVIYAEDTPREVIAAIEELWEHRLQQIGGYKKEHLCRRFSTPPQKSAIDFLRREGVSLAETALAEDMPYYLLVVGSPDDIPFSFQYELGQQYAVGRLYFEGEVGGHDPERYRNYVDNVIATEGYETRYPRRASFFGAVNHDDPASCATAEDLVTNLADELATSSICRRHAWQVECHIGPEATKAHLQHLLSNIERPTLLFAGGHGLYFSDEDHEDFRTLQGSLVCSTGPDTARLRQHDYTYSARDLTDERIDLNGLIAFFFACYSAGTPANDDFSKIVLRGDMRQPFVANLPQAMLGRKNGALAVIGHVERTWTSTFRTPDSGLQIRTFSNALKRLLDGKPVGNALGRFAVRHGHLALWLQGLKMMNEDLKREGEPLPHYEKGLYARLWKNDRDARNFIVLGDPAVRINLEEY